MQRDVLDQADEPSLRAYVVWVAVLPDDSEAAARASASLVPDARASHYWDASRAAEAFRPELGLPEGTPAWDVYLLYGREARWGATPPAPAYWAHQLGDEIAAPRLDGGTMRAALEAALSSTD
jgi:hypothetical protein